MGATISASAAVAQAPAGAATLGVDDEVQALGHVAIRVVDNAGTGIADTFDAVPAFPSPADCSTFTTVGLLARIATGGIKVVDAPGPPDIPPRDT